MGICSSCFKGSSDAQIIMPTAEIRRKLQQEAAEKRQVENEYRGIKDPEKVRRMQERSREMERRQEEAYKQGTANPSLKWQTD